MDVLERVREVNAGTSLDEARIRRSRSLLMARLDADRRAPRGQPVRRPLLLVAGALVGVAAVTTTAVVIVQQSEVESRVEADPVRPDEPRPPITSPAPTASPTEQSLSAWGAAVDAIRSSDLQEGQFLRITTTSDRVTYLDAAGAVFEGMYGSDLHPVAAAVLRSGEELYMPADRDAEWAHMYGPFSEVLFRYGPDSPSIRDTWARERPFEPVSGPYYTTGAYDTINGDPYVGSAAQYAQYPGDPAELLEWLENQGSGEYWAANALIDVLRSNFAPPETRAEFLEALELTDWAHPVESGDGVVAFVVDFPDGRKDTISLDAISGWAIAYSSTRPRADSLVPADVPDIRETYVVSVVDSAP